jgi:aldose sugar dehydrogenase
MEKDNLNLSVFILLIIVVSSCKMPEGPVSLSGNVPEANGWATQVVLDGLEQPWAMAWLPDGLILITERPGRMILYNENEHTIEYVNGIPDVYSDGQGGLLDIILHPDFENNRLIYFTFAIGNDNHNQTAVARGEFNGTEVQNVEIIFRAKPEKSGNQHFGSRMAWLDDGTLLVSVGDGGNRPKSIDGILSREYAQKLNTHLGKIIRINDDGSVPVNNPFIGQENALPEIWSIGHRNIQGLTFDEKRGHVWANEHGSRGGDELNQVSPGLNYGWPIVTYSREYYGLRISRKTSMPGMVDPVIVWTPAQAPSGLTVYNGNIFKEWKGDLFSGGLRGKQVRRILLNGSTVVGEESLTIGYRVRDVKTGPDGYLYLLTAENNGKLIKIIPETGNQ